MVKESPSKDGKRFIARLTKVGLSDIEDAIEPWWHAAVRNRHATHQQDQSGVGVYWLCDTNGDPLYIGKSQQMDNRLDDHSRRRDKDHLWNYDHDRRWVCGSPATADALERRMIDTHDPPWNKQKWKPKPLGEVG